MYYRIIDIDTWERKELYNHYLTDVPCGYSMTVKIDITDIKSSGRKLYPAMLHCLAATVNRHSEFRMKLDDRGRLIVFDRMHPGYTVFHKDTETFSNIWTEYREDYEKFYMDYKQDIDLYGNITGFEAKPNTPENVFTVSMIPWESFDSFNLNLPLGNSYLLPIFTIGKYYEENGRFILPLAIQVHHAVCDGFHLCRFIDDLRNCIGIL